MKPPSGSKTAGGECWRCVRVVSSSTASLSLPPPLSPACSAPTSDHLLPRGTIWMVPMSGNPCPLHEVREGSGCAPCAAQVPALLQRPADGHQPLEPKRSLQQAELMEKGGGGLHAARHVAGLPVLAAACTSPAELVTRGCLSWTCWDGLENGVDLLSNTGAFGHPAGGSACFEFMRSDFQDSEGKTILSNSGTRWLASPLPGRKGAACLCRKRLNDRKSHFLSADGAGLRARVL